LPLHWEEEEWSGEEGCHQPLSRELLLRMLRQGP